MNIKALLPLIFALVLGLAAAFMAKGLLMKKPQAEGPASTLVPVVVLKADVAPGMAITADVAEVAHMDPKGVPESHFTSLDQLTGRVVTNVTPKGMPVVESQLAALGAGTGLQALIPAGMRAITLEVNEFTGVAGLLSVGCTVDVISTFQAGSAGEILTRTIVQNIKVTAVGQVIGGAPNPENGLARSVTLLATPKDAEAIALASTLAAPRLVLRGGRDGKPSPSTGITLAELRGRRSEAKDPFVEGTPAEVKPISNKPATQPAERVKTSETHTIKVIKAGAETSVQLEVPIQTPGVFVGGQSESR